MRAEEMALPAARVVPADFGTDWTAEIDSSSIWMKVVHDKTTATAEVVSSHPGETIPWSQNCRRNTARVVEKPVVDWKNELQNYEADRK
jgi:hypothetical protein